MLNINTVHEPVRIEDTAKPVSAVVIKNEATGAIMTVNRTNLQKYRFLGWTQAEYSDSNKGKKGLTSEEFKKLKEQEPTKYVMPAPKEPIEPIEPKEPIVIEDEPIEPTTKVDELPTKVESVEEPKSKNKGGEPLAKPKGGRPKGSKNKR